MIVKKRILPNVHYEARITWYEKQGKILKL